MENTNSNHIQIVVLIILTAVATIAIFGCGSDKTTIEKVPIQGDAGQAGPQGPAGKDGATGPQGADGSSCSVTTVSPSQEAPAGGALIQCADTSVLVKNGVPGSDGQAGAPGSSESIELIDPCGKTPNIYNEVLLKLSNGDILASFSDNDNGKNTRLSLITKGTYETTDGSKCVFTVNNGIVSW